MFFDQFSMRYKDIRIDFGPLAIFKYSFLYKWSFWLDEHDQQIESETNHENGNIMKSLRDFLDKNDYKNMSNQ